MMGHFTDRWYLTFTGLLGAIIAVGAAGLVAGGSSSGAESPQAQRPTHTAVVRMTATPAADLATLDFARALDLLALRDALTAHYAEHGSFPRTSGGVETLCDDPDDAGCALAEVNDALKFNDGAEPYWYVSDGQTYTLIARASLEQPSGQSCPARLPGPLADGPVMCMFGRGD